MYRPEHKKGPPRRFIVSIQPFSITISSGTSNTATINAVDLNRSCIIWGGSSGNSTVTGRITATVTLTNSTTVTATRGVSTASTCTVTGAVVEFSPAFVNQVQSATITLAAASSGTATITAVDTSRSIVVATGSQVSAAGSALPAALAQITLTNATTVTAKAGGTSSNTFGFTVVEFQPGAIAQLAAGGLDVTDTNASNAVTITPGVQADISCLLWAGWIGANNALDRGLTRAALTDGATVTHTRVGTGSNEHGAAVTVAQFNRAAIRRIQRGAISISGATSGTATIERIPRDRSVVVFLGCDGQAAGTIDQALASLVLTDETTVTASLGSSGTTTVSFAVITFN